MTQAPPAREFDVVLQGATGFTGRLAAEELARRAPEGLRWAVAGRSAERVAAVAGTHGVPGLVADGLDVRAVESLAARTRVVVSCAGPFSRYGTALVAACVDAGTHYADLTGELPWVAELVAKHHAACTARGVTLVPCSGFDSVPADLAVLAMVREFEPTDGLHGFFRIRGGLNGGTLHSGLALGEAGQLHPPPASDEPRVFRVPSLDRWAAPFLMAPVNEWVVARSGQLLDEEGAGYGAGFRYSEHLAERSRGRALFMAGLLGASNWMLRSRVGRGLLARLGPKPGEGPSAESIAAGFARLVLIAGPLDAPDATRRWDWRGDPSNRITVSCLVQTALALAAGEARRGGVLTPASALGLGLLERLEAIDAVRSVAGD